MAGFPRCAALLRNGQPCGRTVAKGSEFCVHHTELLESVDSETMRRGRTPKKRTREGPALRVVTESSLEVAANDEAATVTGIDPASVRPLLAAAAAENVEQLTASLLEAAGSAVKPVWLTVECSGCGERSRVEAPVPDVRSRLAAIELLLREGLGRAPQAEEPTTPQLPESAEAVERMSWQEMQRLASVLYVEQITAVVVDGGEARVREQVAGLSEDGRRLLREALLELEPV